MFDNETMEKEMIIHHRIGWKELLHYNKNPPKISFPKGLKIYNKYKMHILKINKINNIHQYLLEYLFKNNDFYIIKNADFSYYVSEYIIHKILWFNPIYYDTINLNYEYVIKLLKNKFKNFIVFENIQNNKSVKKIKHFHFFILKINKFDISQ
jgi:hypothetical protein